MVKISLQTSDGCSDMARRETGGHPLAQLPHQHEVEGLAHCTAPCRRGGNSPRPLPSWVGAFDAGATVAGTPTAFTPMAATRSLIPRTERTSADLRKLAGLPGRPASSPAARSS